MANPKVLKTLADNKNRTYGNYHLRKHKKILQICAKSSNLENEISEVEKVRY